MDFGLAKRDAGEITMTMDGQILGTPAYMSPEQADEHASARALSADEWQTRKARLEKLGGSPLLD
jgi:serine/threonine protein kinase